jgi:hypothetical protein
LIVGLLAVGLRTIFLNSFPVSYDEAIHLIWLRLLSAGYKPYSEVYITYPPFYPFLLEAVWNLSPTEVAQRWFSLAYTLFGAVGVALLARKIAGTVAGVAAAALILFSPILFEASRAVLAEFPSVAWSIWAIWFILLYQEAATTRGKYVYLILSGLCTAASLLTKVLSPFIVVLILLMLGVSHKEELFSRPPRIRAYVTHAAVWTAALIVPALILVGVVFDVSSITPQVINQRLMARTAYSLDPSSLETPQELILTFVSEDTALIVLAIAGVILFWLKPGRYGGLLAAWFLLAALVLAIHIPLRSKHFLVFLPILAIFGGVAISYWSTQLRRRKFTPYTMGSLALITLIYLWQVPLTLNRWETKAAKAPPPADEAQMLEFIDKVIAPDDCLITDDAPFLYWSGRMTPPQFAEMSANRLISGSLSVAEAIAISNQYDCQVVAAIANRIPKYLPDYMKWVKSRYLGLIRYGEDDIFFAKVDTTPRPKVPLWADFSGKLAFHGYSLPDKPVSPGQRMPVKLIWQAQTTLDIDYAIFVQLRDSQGTTRATADYQPYKALVPFSKWPAGATIQTMTWLELPADLPPTDYNIYVGVYDPDTIERLPILADTSGENALILGPVKVRTPDFNLQKP